MGWGDGLRAPGAVPYEAVSDRVKGDVRSRTIVFNARPGVRRAASLVGPESSAIRAGCLFVHWYEPESPDSNRSQFEDEAAELARIGVLSLLVETMWSDPDWFIKRTHADDYQASLGQVEELLAARSLLKVETGARAAPLIYVGHDFGAMYGVLLGVQAPELGAFVLIAGTPRFSDWYFYYPPLSEPERSSYQAEMQPIDPITNIPDLHPRPAFFQFGSDDPHVPQDRARSFSEAAKEPKRVGWYGGGHALDSEARKDRLDWIQDTLKALEMAAKPQEVSRQ